MTPRLAAHLRVWCRPWAVACLVDYVLGLPGPHCPRLAVRFSRGPSSAQRHESFSWFSSVQWLRQIVPWLCWSPCDLESWDCLSRYYVLRLLAPGLGCWARQWLSDEISDETHETHSRRTGRSELRCPLGLAVPGMQLLAKRLLFSANLHCAGGSLDLMPALAGRPLCYLWSKASSPPVSPRQPSGPDSLPAKWRFSSPPGRADQRLVLAPCPAALRSRVAR